MRGARFEKWDLLKRLQNVLEYANTVNPIILASLSKTNPLSAYSDEEVKAKFKKMTREDMETAYRLADLMPTSNACRLILHCAVELANLVMGERTTTFEWCRLSWAKVETWKCPS